MDKKIILLKEAIRKIISEELRLGDRSSLTKYISAFEKAVKSAVGKHATAVYGDMHDVILDDGEGGLAFDVTIRPTSRDVFDVEYIIGSGERSFKKDLSSDAVVKWIKDELKKTKEFESSTDEKLEKSEEADEIDDESKEVKKIDTQEKRADKEDEKAEIDVKKKEVDEKAAVRGLEDATEFDRQEDAKMKKDKVAKGTKFTVAKVNDGMKKASEKKQEDISVKKPAKPPVTKDTKSSHFV